ncbi:hypothetical protein O7626_37405 [Micromonospora sp. WMMD1102]|uniref:hypothetical protein n=1 Tax=Micromonospora sp. WMMD1102 TaxID=3016105 RepID=UPI0024152AFB|nr:hypothetical protein [Micromonospora sp. WMMD1102]MDG4791509.1 hypothetical protein [Micromonospora sp. WMMD1102]
MCDDRMVDEYLVDAGLHLFDCRKFRERVVPAFRQLHGDDEAEPWLAQVWRPASTMSAPVPRFTPHLRRVTAALMAAPDLTGWWPSELAVPDPPRPKRRVRTPPGDGRAPVPAAEPEPVEGRPEWEDLCSLMLAVLEQTCLGEGVAVAGHSLLDWCVDSPEAMLPYDIEVRQLMEWLEERSMAWTAGDEEQPVGVRGWLDADESWLLADALSCHQPIYQAATIAEIEAARRVPGATCSDGNSHPWQLAAIHSIAAIAAEQGQGIAFGWNLEPGYPPSSAG